MTAHWFVNGKSLNQFLTALRYGNLVTPVLNPTILLHDRPGLEESSCSNILLSKITQSPVLLRRLGQAVVAITSRIRRAGFSGSGAAKQDRIDAVWVGVVLTLVKGQDDQRPVGVEVLVGEERRQPAAGPLSGDRHGAVVPVVGHVWRDEHPLGQGVGRQILLEVGEGLGLGKTAGVAGDGFVAHQGTCTGTQDQRFSRLRVLIWRKHAKRKRKNVLVFANVIVGARLLVHIVAREPSVRHVFLVKTPTHALCLEEIDDSLDASGEIGSVVGINTMGAGSGRDNVVGLRGVRDGIVIVEEYPLFGDVCEIC
jgi:hypothetical protein